MNLLLDTHALIWWVQGSQRLGRQARTRIRTTGTQAFISAASVWEIAIKMGRGRLALDPPEDWIPELLANGFAPLLITMDHTFAVRHLPMHHSDPFDRMLIAQAQTEGLTVLTADSHFAAYGISTLDAAH